MVKEGFSCEKCGLTFLRKEDAKKHEERCDGKGKKSDNSSMDKLADAEMKKAKAMEGLGQLAEVWMGWKMGSGNF